MIYLAGPYWHEKDYVRADRCDKLTQVAAKFLENDYYVYSPITHSHLISLYMPKRDHYFWIPYDLQFLSYCEYLGVVTLEGWEQSKGVKMELDFARQVKMRFGFISYEDIIRRTETFFREFGELKLKKGFLE